MTNIEAIKYLEYLKDNYTRQGGMMCQAVDAAIEALKHETIRTNADRIRQMTDEQLVKFLDGIADNCSMQDCKHCPLSGACDDVPISMDKWLKQEAKDDAD